MLGCTYTTKKPANDLCSAFLSWAELQSMAMLAQQRLTRGARPLASLALALAALTGWSTKATELPAGTNLEVRLLAPTGSRVSHLGDRIHAIVIAPVMEGGVVRVPQGSILSGSVVSVHRLGLGLKHCTASIEIGFNSLEFPIEPTNVSTNQINLPGGVLVTGRVLQVETAKERVNDQGVIGGIHPALNLSSGFSIFISALLMEPGIAVPVMGVKFLLVRSPDPEIYFPSGTEMIVQLKKPADLPRLTAAAHHLPELSPADDARVRTMLNKMPSQQAERGAKDEPSDLANVLLLGRQDQIDRAFRGAGWTGAQAHNAIALYRMFYCVVSRAGYSRAPMRNLKLNGIPQQAGYQKSLDTFAKRHHIRLWNEFSDEAGPDVWLSAATEDLSFTVHRMLVNHASDPNIDNERAKVVNDLALTGCLDSASVISRDNLHIATDGMRSIVTDGKIAALRLNDCKNPKNVAGGDRHPVPSRIAHISAVIARDIMRSNPLSLALNTSNMILNREDAHVRKLETVALEAKNHSRRKLPAGEALFSSKWKRPSVVPAPLAGVEGYVATGGR